MTVVTNTLCDTSLKPRLTFVLLTFLCASAAYGQHALCGVGAAVVIAHRSEGDRLQIAGVASNSPAARAGLVANQIISAVDGVPTKGLKFRDCVKLIQGRAGTVVVLEVEDRRRGWTNSVKLIREVVADDPLAVDIATWVETPEAGEPKSLSVTTNQVVRVRGTNGAIAVIQFTQFGTAYANYRWHFRPERGGPLSAGAGVVLENYDRHIEAYGTAQLTHRGGPEDLKVNAGDFSLEWSLGSLTNGWLYYYPSRENVEVLDLSAFESGP